YELMRLSGQEYVDEYASTVKDRLAARARSAVDQARVQVEQARVQVEQAREQVRDQVEQARGQVRDQVEQARERFSRDGDRTGADAERVVDDEGKRDSGAGP
ncbi:MAG: hypothetical protein M3424_02825, partial [Actinomycetota bacterium]|nr:hypothetical protein [Actinomycetota bacterium]